MILVCDNIAILSENSIGNFCPSKSHVKISFLFYYLSHR